MRAPAILAAGLLAIASPAAANDTGDAAFRQLADACASVVAGGERGQAEGLDWADEARLTDLPQGERALVEAMLAAPGDVQVARATAARAPEGLGLWLVAGLNRCLVVSVNTEAGQGALARAVDAGEGGWTRVDRRPDPNALLAVRPGSATAPAVALYSGVAPVGIFAVVIRDDDDLFAEEDDR
jgi:hypothetical protein